MADGYGDVVPVTIRSSRSRSGVGSIFPAAPANQTPALSHTHTHTRRTGFPAHDQKRRSAPLMVRAGSAQEDHASGETGLSSDGTFWQITSVLNTGAGPSPAKDKIASCETVQTSPGVP